MTCTFLPWILVNKHRLLLFKEFLLMASNIYFHYQYKCNYFHCLHITISSTFFSSSLQN
jgi:hypothetical protein